MCLFKPQTSNRPVQIPYLSILWGLWVTYRLKCRTLTWQHSPGHHDVMYARIMTLPSYAPLPLGRSGYCKISPFYHTCNVSMGIFTLWVSLIGTTASLNPHRPSLRSSFFAVCYSCPPTIGIWRTPRHPIRQQMSSWHFLALATVSALMPIPIQFHLYIHERGRFDYCGFS